MAKGVNKVILLGNIGRDPEIRVVAGGSTVATLSLATSEYFKDKAGNKQERTEWHRCVAFGRTAEIIRDYAHKGSRLYLEGKLQTRSWEKDGEKRYSTEIVIRELHLLDFKREGQGQHQHDDNVQRSNVYSTHGAPANDYADQGITDEDIPF